jgi:hypothetical protein
MNNGERMRGKHFSEEAKKNMSAVRLARRDWPTEHRFVDGVEHKFCKYCEEWVPITGFFKSSIVYDGLDNRCKKCFSNQQKEREKIDKEKYLRMRRECTKKWKAKNPEMPKLWRAKNHEKVRSYCKRWAENHPEENRKRYHDYYERNIDQMRAKAKEYNQSERGRERKLRWIENNREKYLAQVKRYNEKRASDPKYRLSHSISSGINAALQGRKKGIHWETLVGYTLSDLAGHLERQFKKGMCWSNYGKWHLDHRVPVAVFNFEKPEDIDFERCWALSNLQPLWSEENIKKQAKLSKPFQPALRIAAKGECHEPY